MLEYVKEMRKYIGHKPLLLCGASVIVIDSNGRVLLQHRKDNDCWGFPGGAVELGERVEDAAVREVFEETGLKIINMDLFGVYSGKELYYKYPNGDEVYNIDVVYISKSYSGDLHVDGFEAKDVRFFAIDEIPQKISPPAKPVINDFIRRYNEYF
ncbi:ADP-ribose pyrophosphatase [Caloranaerobacter sp. TR13]|uniref:NUDIX hydrolase n=1 Tax=Caloranaerobacter sp. TR13 TaxID=1302151 RepID=UPI0006D3F335|nr:NUDIX hydrolase [Caloranaerobacter sp. TR13]KPU26356.1 ADP-ribose pyrophosphatase [Caloranaerobacter sp. TR13]